MKAKNKKDYPYVAIMDRPTDESIEICKKSSKDCEDYYMKLEIPNFESCKKANEDYIKSFVENGEPKFPPYLFEYISKDTYKFLKMWYTEPRKEGYYKFPGNSKYKIEKR